MRRLQHISAAVVLAAVSLATAGPATAAETLISKHGDWEAFSDTEKGKPVCYMGSEPTKARGKYKARGRTFLLITHRPAEKSTNVISFRAGYTFKKGSQVQLTIGKTTFKLFTDGGWAFTPDRDADNDLVKAMIRGATMTVKGTSSRGTLTTDTYSLKGFTAAYRAIGKACKV
ncbi:MAG: invasion associated locus B family protein [Magnetovibrio sp.]|nr:invasion associated locus B family protein [Magnetovibrio sp.]